MVSTRARIGRPATRADLEDLPPGTKGEIIDGELHVQPRPRPRHGKAVSRLYGALSRHGGPDDVDPPGWLLIIEPGIELPDAPEISPDIAGWRLERIAGLDPDQPISVVPDWVCEALSPSNRGYDRVVKFPFYARIGVKHLWVIDPPARTIEIKRLEGGRWVDVAAFAEDQLMRAEPFEAIEIRLSSLWA